MALSRIVRGCDFSMEIAVFTPEYIDGHTQWIDFNILTCSNIAVNLICTKDQVVIPLSWRIKDDSDHVIIADVQGKWLHSGAVYALEITGLDENEKAWRFKNKSIFSVVDATSQAVLDAELMADPLEVNATIGLAAYIEPVVGPQGIAGPQGEKGDKGQDGTFESLTPEQKEELRGPQGEIGLTGPQGPVGEQGEKGQDGTVTFEDLTPEQKEELRGPQGQIGETGQQGDIGLTGPQGEIGLTGPQGETGLTGPQGEIGLTGSQGEIGLTGPQGEIGLTGPQGQIGETGNQGFQGTQGVEGYVPSNTILGYQAGVAVSGIKIDIVQSLPASPDANTLYIVM